MNVKYKLHSSKVVKIDHRILNKNDLNCQMGILL